MIIVNGWKPLTIITKRSILDVAVVLDPPLPLLIIQTPSLSAQFSKKLFRSLDLCTIAFRTSLAIKFGLFTRLSFCFLRAELACQLLM